MFFIILCLAKSGKKNINVCKAVSAHLLSLIMESRKQVEKFNQLVKMTSGNGHLNTTLSQVGNLPLLHGI